ncbi:hypothetical protein YC2023_101728 [Brassica napus]
MYIQTRMAKYAEELWELLEKKDNTIVYMCGLKAMEKGIWGGGGEPTKSAVHGWGI